MATSFAFSSGGLAACRSSPPLRDRSTDAVQPAPTAGRSSRSTAASRSRLLRRPAHRRGRRRPHRSKTFHFGIDISAPDGTAVYATASGRIVWEPQRPETIAIRADDGRVFAYWHIVPAVHNGEYAIAYGTLLGHISRGWGHVHFADSSTAGT